MVKSYQGKVNFSLKFKVFDNIKIIFSFLNKYLLLTFNTFFLNKKIKALLTFYIQIVKPTFEIRVFKIHKAFLVIISALIVCC